MIHVDNDSKKKGSYIQHLKPWYSEHFILFRANCILIIIISLISGCRVFSPSTPVPTPIPSPTEQITNAILPNFPKIPITKSPPTTTPIPIYKLDTEIYVHPKEIIVLPRPVGWIVEQTPDSVSIKHPENQAKIEIYIVNTGYELEEESFNQLVFSREENTFGIFNGYIVTAHDENPDTISSKIVKNFSNDNVNKTVMTSYQQENQFIILIDFWADQGVFASFETAFGIILKNIIFNAEAANLINEYWGSSVYRFEDKLSSFRVPSTWRFEHTEGAYSKVDTFFSPDNHSAIQLTKYDDGEVISKSVAGAFALFLLRSYYTNDIIVTKDIVLHDGRERLDWYSSHDAYHGVSFFESRGTPFLMLTVVYDDEYEGIYRKILDNVLESYIVP